MPRYNKLEDVKSKLHPQPFSVRLPEAVAQKLLAMDSGDRSKLIRKLIIEGIEKLE